MNTNRYERLYDSCGDLAYSVALDITGDERAAEACVIRGFVAGARARDECHQRTIVGFIVAASHDVVAASARRGSGRVEAERT